MYYVYMLCIYAYMYICIEWCSPRDARRHRAGATRTRMHAGAGWDARVWSATARRGSGAEGCRQRTASEADCARGGGES